eukprot:scaffold13994_cov105-Skeletonema_menzelii.AAC.1
MFVKQQLLTCLLVLALSLMTFYCSIYIYPVSLGFSLPQDVTPKKDSSAASTSASAQCLDLNLNKEMDSLVARARQVFVTMPAKAGGSSMDEFAKRCNHETMIRKFGFIEEDDQIQELLFESLHVAPIISSHLRAKGDALIRLAKYPSQKTLMIYIHREEGERVNSGVKKIANHMCKMEYGIDDMKHRYHETVVEKNATHCIIDEGSMVDWIAKRHREVGGGSPDILKCKFYDTALLAKHHCPELLDELPIEKNIAVQKKKKTFMHDGSRGKGSVSLEDWLDAKGPVLEWALDIRSGASCQAKTIHMEKELFACPDEALKVTPESIERW